MEKVEILGVGINNYSLQEVLELVKNFINSKNQHYIVTPNPEILVAAAHDAQFKKILNYADLSVADGVGLQYVASWGKRRLQRVTGVDLLWYITEYAAEQGWPIYLLGAAEGIADTTAAVLREHFPNYNIVGTSSGGLITDPAAPMPELINTVNKLRPKILFVAFGHVKQEKWIFTHLDQLPSVKLAIGVGGAFDYLAGVVRRAPVPLRYLGLEWLYRLIQEPKRWKRIFTAAVIFPILVIKEEVRRQFKIPKKQKSIPDDSHEY